jgi:hypothetical protein
MDCMDKFLCGLQECVEHISRERKIWKGWEGVKRKKHRGGEGKNKLSVASCQLPVRRTPAAASSLATDNWQLATYFPHFAFSFLLIPSFGPSKAGLIGVWRLRQPEAERAVAKGDPVTK